MGLVTGNLVQNYNFPGPYPLRFGTKFRIIIETVKGRRLLIFSLLLDPMEPSSQSRDSSIRRELTNHLAQFVSDHKREFIERVLRNRTRYVTVVLEDIYQSQNASAVLRTAECLGLQDIYIVETRSSWSTNKQVLKGANKWIQVLRYRRRQTNNIGQCIADLKQKGYRVGITDPDPDGVSIDAVPLDQPLAIIMGNEKHGVSSSAKQEADIKIHIPMTGFTESLNISVSAAISLYSVLSRVRASDLPWHLKQDEVEELRVQWYKKVIRNAELIEKEFMRAIQ